MTEGHYETIGGVVTELVLPFESSQEEYIADAWMAWCIDDRFWKLRKRFIEQLRITHVDLFEFAGAAKGLADACSTDQETLLKQLGISIRLHKTKLAILVVHIDCGGYGSSKAFQGRDDEYRHHAEELAKAKTAVNEKFPAITVEKYIADFDGLRKIR